MTTEDKRYIFDLDNPGVIDELDANDRPMWSTLTAADYAAQGRRVEVVSSGEAIERIRAHAIGLQPLTEITEEDWMYFLEVLPPMKWHRSAGAESFCMSERYSLDITMWLVRFDGRCFKLHESCNAMNYEVVKTVADRVAEGQYVKLTVA